MESNVSIELLSQSRIPDIAPGLLVNSQQFVAEGVKDWWDAARPDSCIHQVFERQVERTPAATAVVFGEERLTYEDLNRRANHLAHYLRDRGACADMTVGICLERSVEMVVGMRGVLKAGGGYVPIDREYPAEGVGRMRGHAGVGRLMLHQKLTGKLPAHAAADVGR